MCEYCNDEFNHDMSYIRNFSVEKRNNNLLITYDGQYDYERCLVPINFCPMCGKNLNDTNKEE